MLTNWSLSGPDGQRLDDPSGNPLSSLRDRATLRCLAPSGFNQA
jgi:hypothetical protein